MEFSEILSLVGIVISIAAFVLFTIKGINMLLASVFTALIAAAFNMTNPLTMLTGNFMAGTTSFLKSYMLLFCISALFGKLMYEAGCLRSVAMSIYKFLGKFCKSANGIRFGSLATVIIFYFVMNFAGVSGYVVLFSVLYIASDLWREADVPWELYPYGTSTLLPATVLGGSLYTTNVVTAEAYGVGTADGMLFSVVLVGIMLIVIFTMAYLDIVKRAKKGEGFMPSAGTYIAGRAQTNAVEAKEANPAISFCCLLLPIVINLLGAHVLVAMFIGCILAVVCNLGHYPKDKLKLHIGEGVSSGINAIMGCAGMMGVFAIYKSSTGFAAALEVLGLLPEVVGACLLIFICSGITGQMTGGVTTVIDVVMPKFAAAGVSAPIAQRLSLSSSCLWGLPHNSGIVNGINLTKINPKKGFLMYIKTTMVPSFIATVIGIILVSLGVFH